MTNLGNIRLKYVGDVLPYVYIDSVEIDLYGSAKSEDTQVSKTQEPSFIKNEFGTNKQQTKTAEMQDEELKQINVKLSLNDLLNNSFWYRTAAATNIKIKVITATSARVFDRLTKGSVTDVEQLKSDERQEAKQKIISFSDKKSLNSYAVKHLSEFEDVLCTISCKEQFVVNSKFVGVVAFAYLENSGMMGTISSRRVIDNNRIVDESYAFYSPDGTLWRGPVHTHNGVVMEGRRHTNRPHNVLTPVKHRNKVKDLRVFSNLSEIQQQFNFKVQTDEPRRYCSDLFTSTDKFGVVSGFFVFDYLQYLKQNAEFNSLIVRKNFSRLRSLMDVKTLSIVREEITDPLDIKVQKISTSTSREGRSFISPNTNREKRNNKDIEGRLIGSTREIRLAGLRERRAFSFVDNDIASVGNGKYIYRADVEVVDPTIKFMQIQLFALREARKIILSYYEEAKDQNNFSLVTGEFKNEYLEYLKRIYNLDLQTKGTSSKPTSVPWRTSAHMYFKVLETLLGRNVPKRIKRELQKSLLPSSKTLKGVEKFIKLIDDLIAKLQPSEPSRKENTSRAAGGRRQSNTSIEVQIQNRFNNNIIDAGELRDRKYYINYFKGISNRSEGTLPIVRRNVLISRFNAEASKFFPSVVGRNERDVTNPALSGFRKKYFSSITPTTVETDDEEIAVNFRDSKSLRKILRVLRRRKMFSNFSKTQSSLANLSELGVNIKRRKKPKAQKNQATKYFGEEDNVSVKQSEKPSDVQEERKEGGSFVASPEEEFFETAALLDGKELEKYSQSIRSADSLQARYAKLTQQARASSSQSASLQTQIIDETTAKVEYVSGFDEDLNPIKTEKLPVTSEAVPYVITDSGGLAVDAVGVIIPGGETATIEPTPLQSLSIVVDGGEFVVGDDGNLYPVVGIVEDEVPAGVEPLVIPVVIDCEDKDPVPTDEPSLEPKPIPTEPACPDGWIYVDGECVPERTSLVVPVNEEEPPSIDTEPDFGQTVVDEIPKDPVAVQAEETLVSGVPVSSTEQQESYFIRRRIAPETREGPAVDSALNFTTTSGGTSGY